MQMPSAVFLLTLLLWAPAAAGQEGPRPRRPGLREAEQAEQKLAVERPRTTVSFAVDPARLRQEAEELAKLSATVQGQVNQAARGMLSKDLAKNLKQVEKLARRLRAELTPP